MILKVFTITHVFIYNINNERIFVPSITKYRPSKSASDELKINGNLFISIENFKDSKKSSRAFLQNWYRETYIRVYKVQWTQAGATNFVLPLFYLLFLPSYLPLSRAISPSEPLPLLRTSTQAPCFSY